MLLLKRLHVSPGQEGWGLRPTRCSLTASLSSWVPTVGSLFTSFSR